MQLPSEKVTLGQPLVEARSCLVPAADSGPEERVAFCPMAYPSGPRGLRSPGFREHPKGSGPPLGAAQLSSECQRGSTRGIAQIRTSSSWLARPQSYFKACFYFSDSVSSLQAGFIGKLALSLNKNPENSPPATLPCLLGKELQDQLKP